MTTFINPPCANVVSGGFETGDGQARDFNTPGSRCWPPALLDSDCYSLRGRFVAGIRIATHPAGSVEIGAPSNDFLLSQLL